MRSSEHQCALAFFLAVAVAACGGSQQQISTETAGPEAQSAEPGAPSGYEVPSDPLQLLPASCMGAWFVDLEALRKSPLFQKQQGEFVEDLDDAEKRVADLVLKNAETAVVGFAWSEKRTRQKNHVLLVARGDFRQASLVSKLEAMAKSGQLKGVEPGAAAAGDAKGPLLAFSLDENLGGAVLDHNTVVVGSPSLLTEVMRLVSGEPVPLFVDSELYRRMSPHVAMGESPLSAVSATPNAVGAKLRGKAVGGSDADPAGKAASMLKQYDEILDGISAVGARMDLEDGVRVIAVAETASKDHPPLLAGLAQMLLGIIRLASEDPALAEIAENIAVGVDGLFLRVSLHVTEEQAERLLQEAEKR